MNVKNSGTQIVGETTRVHVHLSITEGDIRRELLGPDVLSFELRGSSLYFSLSCGFSSDGIRKTHVLDAIRFERRPRSVAKVSTYLSPHPRPHPFFCLRLQKMFCV